jgi:hypothetical protein
MPAEPGQNLENLDTHILVENLDTHILGEPGHPHLSRTWQNLDTHILEN